MPWDSMTSDILVSVASVGITGLAGWVATHAVSWLKIDKDAQAQNLVNSGVNAAAGAVKYALSLEGKSFLDPAQRQAAMADGLSMLKNGLAPYIAMIGTSDDMLRSKIEGSLGAMLPAGAALTPDPSTVIAPTTAQLTPEQQQALTAATAGATAAAAALPGTSVGQALQDAAAVGVGLAAGGPIGALVAAASNPDLDNLAEALWQRIAPKVQAAAPPAPVAQPTAVPDGKGGMTVAAPAAQTPRPIPGA